MHIKNPRHILLLSPPSPTLAPAFLRALTSGAPPPSDSYAGTVHEWEIKTQYYTATVPIWVDEITSVEDWTREFSKDEAGEVVRAVGGWIFAFELGYRPDSAARQIGGRKTQDEVREVLESIGRIIEAHCSDDEAVKIAVGYGGSLLGDEEREAWDDMCLGEGYEFVEARAEGKNAFGESIGIARVREALEAGEWEGGGMDDGLGFGDVDGAEDDFEGEDDFGDFGHEEAEMNAELFGLKASLLNPDDRDEDEAEAFGNAMGEQAREKGVDQRARVEDLDAMMGKLLAIRERGADLPEAQRKRMAARAVKDLMGDFPID